jgi:FAD:protein FMN transferase
LIAEYEERFDYRREGGALYRFNRGTTLEKNEDSLLYDLVKKAVEAAELTGGFFDPTILPVIHVWGFDTDSPKRPPDNLIRESLKNVGYKRVEVHEDRIVKPADVSLDLSGIAKGRIVDLASDFLKSGGYRDFLVNAGGDVYVNGRNAEGKKWRIAIQDPVRPDHYSAMVNKTDSAVVTSGDYERFFVEGGKRYCHLFNPFTGYPGSDIRSTTILAGDTMFADAIATAVSVMGSKEGFAFLLRSGIEGYLIYNGDGDGVESKNTPGFWK